MIRPNLRYLSVQQNGEAMLLCPKGSWSLSTLSDIFGTTAPEPLQSTGAIIIDGSELSHLDTAGAVFLLDLIHNQECEFKNFSKEHLAITQLVRKGFSAPIKDGAIRPLTIIERIGKLAIEVGNDIHDVINFLGYTLTEIARAILHPRLFRIREFFVQLEMGCVSAVSIIALVTFLIGIVIAYLFASQSQKYGANIFIVESIGLAMCRELSPLIVAVVVAGRSGSAFTAQIGTMKLNEEIDALSTLGLSPMQVLVIPRVIALMIAMPILVFVGDVVGIFGGSIIAHIQLNITPITFLERLQFKLPPKHMWVGLVKAPIFALFIALIGCKMGLTVENNARSVGIHTTSTVVQSIVSVILLNALFAIICVELKI